MSPKEAGRRGGLQKSFAKKVAARQNGARGGRPSTPLALLRRMRAMHARIIADCQTIDPDDLWLIIERLCRGPRSNRHFFIYPRQDGGYEF